MVVSVMLIAGVYKSRRSPDQIPAGPSLKGQLAPDFALQALDGKTVHLSDFRGKAVLLNFCASSCLPCKLEMPWFPEQQNHYAPERLPGVDIAVYGARPRQRYPVAATMGVHLVVPTVQ